MESILGLLKSLKIRSHAKQAGGIDSLESTLGLLQSLKIRARELKFAFCCIGSDSEDEADITRSVAEGLKKFRQDHEEAERRRNEIRRRSNIKLRFFLKRK